MDISTYEGYFLNAFTGMYCVLCTQVKGLCTVYTRKWTVYCVLCTQVKGLCTVYKSKGTVYFVLCIVYTSKGTGTVQCVLCTVYCVLCTQVIGLCTVYCVLCTQVKGLREHNFNMKLLMVKLYHRKCKILFAPNSTIEKQKQHS